MFMVKYSILTECLKCIIQAFLKVLNGIFQISQLSDTIVILMEDRGRCSGVMKMLVGLTVYLTI